MAKSDKPLVKKYPDVSAIFVVREKLRRKRAEEPPSEKLRVLGELQELDRILKSAKVVKKGGVRRD